MSVLHMIPCTGLIAVCVACVNLVLSSMCRIGLLQVRYCLGQFNENALHCRITRDSTDSVTKGCVKEEDEAMFEQKNVICVNYYGWGKIALVV